MTAILSNEVCDEILSMDFLEAIKIEEEKDLKPKFEEKLQPYTPNIQKDIE